MLPEKTIAVEPPQRWHGATLNQSVKARQWLHWEEQCLRVNYPLSPTGARQEDRIHHTGNGRERRVFTPAHSYLVDGFDPQSNTVSEFNGCLWHGCPTCFPNRGQKSVRTDRTFGEL